MFNIFPFFNNSNNIESKLENKDLKNSSDQRQREKESSKSKKENKKARNSKKEINKTYKRSKSNYNKEEYNKNNFNNINNVQYGSKPQNNNYNMNGFYSSQNTNLNNTQNLINMIAGSFNTIFNEVFTTVMENQDIITDIVDSVLNSDVVNNIVNSMEEEIELNFIEYEDRYLIEGKLRGVNKNDIDIDYENNYVKIKLKKDLTFTNGTNTMIHIFKDSPDFEKTYYVSNINPSKIKAVYKDDILKIYLKKKEIENKETTIIDVDYSNV